MSTWMNGKTLMNNTTLLEKKEFYCNLNMDDITDVDYMYAKRNCEDFEIKGFGEYHDLYLRSDTLPLADVFENFRKTSLKIYHLDPVKFLSAPGLHDTDMLLIVEKGIR